MFTLTKRTYRNLNSARKSNELEFTAEFTFNSSRNLDRGAQVFAFNFLIYVLETVCIL